MSYLLKPDKNYELEKGETYAYFDNGAILKVGKEVL